MHNNLLCTVATAASPHSRAAPNGGSARGYQETFVPPAALTSPGYGPIGGQPAVYLYIAALEVNVLKLPRTGSP
jgi:hypothetical protein